MFFKWEHSFWEDSIFVLNVKFKFDLGIWALVIYSSIYPGSMIVAFSLTLSMYTVLQIDHAGK